MAFDEVTHEYQSGGVIRGIREHTGKIVLISDDPETDLAGVLMPKVGQAHPWETGLVAVRVEVKPAGTPLIEGDFPTNRMLVFIDYADPGMCAGESVQRITSGFKTLEIGGDPILDADGDQIPDSAASIFDDMDDINIFQTWMVDPLTNINGAIAHGLNILSCKKKVNSQAWGPYGAGTLLFLGADVEKIVDPLSKVGYQWKVHYNIQANAIGWNNVVKNHAGAMVIRAKNPLPYGNFDFNNILGAY